MCFLKICYLFGIGEQPADRAVVVKRIDKQGNILCHIDLYKPLSREQLRSTVDKVGGKEIIKLSVFIRLVDLIQSLTEQSEGGEEKDPARPHLAELMSNVHHRLS